MQGTIFYVHNGLSSKNKLIREKRKLWKVWTQQSFQKKVEFDRPGERTPE